MNNFDFYSLFHHIFYAPTKFVGNELSKNFTAVRIIIKEIQDSIYCTLDT